jgi:hypothetical protein
MTSRSEEREGTIVADRFEIERLAGSGGMGLVYRARDRVSGNSVALKVLASRVDQGDAVTRFMREANMLARLRHPAIVEYVSHGVTPAGEAYLAMEWLEGEDLASRLARGALSLQDAVALARRAAEALAEAHRNGIVHRDLKPSNLFLRDGKPEAVALLDFGIARQVVGARALTQTNQRIGTPEYMAPEQVRGEKDIGAAADLFSLGCVLFECITGVSPFAHAQIGVVLAGILLEDPRPIESFRSGVPRPLSGLVSRLMAKEPGDRPPSAEALRTELDTIDIATADGQTMPAPPAVGPTLGRAERQMVGLVLATDTRDAGTARTVAFGSPDSRKGPPTALRAAVAGIGAEVGSLPDGSVLVTVSVFETATDLALRTARCALVAKELWPEATISMCLCRAVVGDKRTLDAGIERAARARDSQVGSGDRATPITSEGVWVDELSAGLLDPHFDVKETQGRLQLRGERAALDTSRLVLGKPTPCVGREQDLAQLEVIWRTCVAEPAACAVVITGAPGVGKSRLRHELVRRLAVVTPGILILGATASALSAGSPYGLLRQALRTLFDVRANEPPAEQRARIRARVSGADLPENERQRVSEYLGELCGVPFDDEHSPHLKAARRDPKVMGDQVSHAFLTFLRAECRRAPVLLVLEDLQWGDILTVRLVDTALRELADEPLMVVALGRPELDEVFPKLWIDRAARQIRLAPLSRKACERLAREILGSRVGPATLDRLVKQAQGNALFLEELVRARAEGKGDTPPDTVLAILEGRLARLDPEARRILRAAAIFGERFWRGGVAVLVSDRRTPADLDAWLGRLVEAEILVRSSMSRFKGEVEYGFRHALVRDAAYALLIDIDRARGHATAADYLLRMGEDDPIVLADHFREGGDRPRAAEYYLRAARESYQRCALDATQARAGAGLACKPAGEVLGGLLHLELAARFSREEYPAVIDLAPPVIEKLAPGTEPWCFAVMQIIVSAGLTGRYDVFGRWMPVFAAANPADERAALAYVEGATWLSVLFNIQAMREPATMWVERVAAVGKQSGAEGNPLFTGYTGCARGCYHEHTEDRPEVRAAFNGGSARAFREVDDIRHAHLMFVYYYKDLAELGDRAAAETGFRETLVEAERLQEPMVLGYAKTYLARHLAAGTTEAEWEEAHSLASDVTKMANASMVGIAHAALATVAAHRGDIEQALAQAALGAQVLAIFPAYRYEVVALWLDLLVRAGRPAEAAASADVEIAAHDATRTHGYGEVPLRRAAAEAYAAAGAKEKAEAALRAAVAALEARASTIEDLAVRARYLSVAENARVGALAAEWGIAGG